MNGRGHPPFRTLILWLGCVLLLALTSASPAFAQKAELNVSASVEPGSNIEVEWQGPDAPGDFIALAEPGAPATDFAAYAWTNRGNPALLTAPAAGEYEVRYISAAGLEVMAAVRLTVEQAQAAAALAAPSEARPGELIIVSVTDPGDPADYVTIVAAEAPDTALGPYARLRGAREVTIEAPDEAGVYEIRQVRAVRQSILARAQLAVVAPAPEEGVAAPATGTTGGDETRASTATAALPEVSLMALIAVDRGRAFRVAWTGPGGGDRIALVPSGADTGAPEGATLPQDGSPAALRAPEAPGDYEILYIHGASGAVLARRRLEVR